MIKNLLLSLCLVVSLATTAEAANNGLACVKARKVASKACTGKKKNKLTCSNLKKAAKIACKIVKSKDTALVCTQIVNPVCAQPPMTTCPTGRVCAQVMPMPRIYQNSCFAARDNAKIVNAKYCDNVLGSELTTKM